MATTGVPNKLYKGTDAPNLVNGPYAGHTHDYTPQIEDIYFGADAVLFSMKGEDHTFPSITRTIGAIGINASASGEFEPGQDVNVTYTINSYLVKFKSTVYRFNGTAYVYGRVGDNYIFYPCYIVNINKVGSQTVCEFRAGTHTGTDNFIVSKVICSGLLT